MNDSAMNNVPNDSAPPSRQPPLMVFLRQLEEYMDHDVIAYHMIEIMELYAAGATLDHVHSAIDLRELTRLAWALEAKRKREGKTL